MMKKSRIIIMAIGMIVVLAIAGYMSTKVDNNSDKDEMVKDEMVKDGSVTTESTTILDATNDTMEEDTTVMMTNEGDLAPEFEFVDFEGNLYNNDSFKGEKTYLKYWASWCSICLAGLDEVDDLFTEEDEFTVYTVVTPNANGEQTQEDFIAWFNGLEQKNVKVLFDMKGQAAREFGVRAFPTSVFIGSDGVLISTTPGHKSNEEILKKIDEFY